MKIFGDPKKERIVTIVVCSLFIIVIIVSTIIRNSITSKLINHGIITNGLITDITSSVRGDFSIVYSFTFNGRQYKNDYTYSELLLRYQNNFDGKVFPVIYLPEDPTINYLLVTPNSFKEYDKSFPDSLNWVKLYMK